MKPLFELTLADIMNRSIHHVSPDCTLGEAARQMSEARISSLLVMENQTAMGILTERDLAGLLVNIPDGRADTIALREVMHTPVQTISYHTPIFVVAGLMQEQQFYHLVVVTDDGQLMGMVTLHNLMERITAVLLNEKISHQQEKVERDKQVAEQRLRMAVEATGIGFWEFNLSTQQLYCSDTLLQTIGLSAGQAPTNLEAWIERIHPDERARVIASYKITKVTQQPDNPMIDVEYRISHKNGQWVWIHSRGQVVDCEITKQPELLVGTAINITESKLAEIALLETKTKLAIILDNIAAAVYIKDTDYRYQFVNRNDCELFNYKLEDIVGKNDTAFFDAATSQQLRINDRRVIEDGERLETIEVNKLETGGEQHSYLTVKLPLRNSDGITYALCGISTDVTQFKLMEMQSEVERRTLELLTQGESLTTILTYLTIGYEKVFQGLLCSALLLSEDGRHLKHGAAPSLPAAYCQAIDGVEIGACVGSCGTAAYTKKTTIVTDISSDPLWHNYKELALTHGLHACWSVPILSSKGRVLGTFALYYSSPRSPLPEEITTLERGAYLASLAIEHIRTENALRHSEASLKHAQSVAKIGNWRLDLEHNLLECSAETYRIFGTSLDTPLNYEQFLGRVHPEDRVSVEAAWQDALKGVSYRIEYRIVVRGEISWVEEHADLEFDAMDKCVAYIGTVQDITERKQAEEAFKESEARFRKLVKVLPIPLCYISKTGVIEDFNDRFIQIFGYSHEDIPTIEEWWHLAYPDEVYRKWVIETWNAAVQTATEEAQDIMPIEYRVTCKNGDIRTMEITGVIFGGGLLATFIDLTTRRQAEHEMRKLSQAVEQSSNAIIITDLNARIEYVNAAFVNYTGYSPNEVIGKNPRLLQSGKTPRSTYEDMWAHLTRGENWIGEFINKHKNNTEYIESVRISPIRQADGRITHYLGIKEDVTKQKFAEERIQYLAHFDALTGLPNRTLLDDRARYTIRLAHRSQKPLAVLFLDLDHFKDINDTLGHSVGDALLVEVATRLKGILREEDTVSRPGGDEFIMLLPDTNARGAALVAQKLLDVIAQPCRIEHYDLNVTVSIGIAIYPNDGSDLETLSKNADTAMYRVKREGRHGYCLFTAGMHERSARHLQLVNTLRYALERDQLHVVYQPQISLRDGLIIGAEALLRWQHPELGSVSPTEFIPIAEDSGLIIPIGEWMLRTAVQQAKTWLDSNLTPIIIAVNLSAVQFRHASLPKLVMSILDEAQLPPEYLELELTEGVAMHDPKDAIKVMNKLHECGIRMSIDDFGTGYSSLSYLKKFKVYKLKIDQSFVHDISTDLEDRAIVSAVINMAKSLGLKTIAEGVETAEQLAFLQNQECDEAQGYYYSKPLRAEQFEAFYRQVSQTER